MRSKLIGAALAASLAFTGCGKGSEVDPVLHHVADAFIDDDLRRYEVEEKRLIQVGNIALNVIILEAAENYLEEMEDKLPLFENLPDLIGNITVTIDGQAQTYKPASSNIKKHTFVIAPEGTSPPPGKTPPGAGNFAVTLHPVNEPKLSDETVSMVIEHPADQSHPWQAIITDTQQAISTELCQSLIAVEPLNDPLGLGYVEARRLGQELLCNSVSIALELASAKNGPDYEDYSSSVKTAKLHIGGTDAAQPFVVSAEAYDVFRQY